MITNITFAAPSCSLNCTLESLLSRFYFSFASLVGHRMFAFLPFGCDMSERVGACARAPYSGCGGGGCHSSRVMCGSAAAFLPSFLFTLIFDTAAAPPRQHVRETLEISHFEMSHLLVNTPAFVIFPKGSKTKLLHVQTEFKKGKRKRLISNSLTGCFIKLTNK